MHLSDTSEQFLTNNIGSILQKLGYSTGMFGKYLNVRPLAPVCPRPPRSHHSLTLCLCIAPARRHAFVTKQCANGTAARWVCTRAGMSFTRCATRGSTLTTCGTTTPLKQRPAPTRRRTCALHRMHRRTAFFIAS